MSHFYGFLTGSRNKTITRCGHKSTGISARIQSWRHQCNTSLHFNEQTGHNWLSITVTNKDGNLEFTKDIDLGAY